jgi:hypothetical protein
VNTGIYCIDCAHPVSITIEADGSWTDLTCSKDCSGANEDLMEQAIDRMMRDGDL